MGVGGGESGEEGEVRGGRDGTGEVGGGEGGEEGEVGQMRGGRDGTGEGWGEGKRWGGTGKGLGQSEGVW